MEQVQWARGLARRLLAEPLPIRWAHTQGVGQKAESIAHILGDEAELLVCAAWLHDIGYAPRLVKTGFHPLDGARYLRDIRHGDDRVCRLVANHSCAIVEATNRLLGDDLFREFPPDDGMVSDALTYCDMTTGPDGNQTSVAARLDEIVARYGAGNLVTTYILEARPQIISAIQKISRRL